MKSFRGQKIISAWGRRITKPDFSQWAGHVATLFILIGLVLMPHTGQTAAKSDDISLQFDRANTLYEQGDYTNAAIAYQALSNGSREQTTIYFNLGNAWYKAGALGRAIAAYRQGERLNPRNPSLRFNLNYARKQVTGDDAPRVAVWKRLVGRLTLNEWTLLAAGFLWLFFILLALQEWRPRLRQPLFPYILVTGVVFAVCAVALALVFYLQQGSRPGVIVVPEAIVRYGPLAESQVSFQLRDGSEIELLGEKKVTTASGEEFWWQVRNRAGRIGWLRSDQALRIR